MIRTLLILLAIPLTAFGADTLTVQGRLSNAAGLPAPDGEYGVVFTLWTLETGGVQLWQETYTGSPAVSVVDGIFSVELGKTTPLLPETFVGGGRWLEVQVVPDAPLPRRRIDSVPVALVARRLDCTGCVPLEALTVVPATAVALDAVSLALQAHIADAVAHGPHYTDLAAIAAIQGAPSLALSGPVDLAAKGTKGLRLEVGATAPVVCATGVTGYLYFNTTDKQVLVCDGTNFVPMVNEVPYGSPSRPGTRCKQILDAGDSVGDGVYWLDLDGPTGPYPASTYYCDMTTDGGGWTRMEGARWPWLFNGTNWMDTNPASPTGDNYSRLAQRSAFADGFGCYTWRITVGKSASWVSARDFTTVWKQCHDAFTATTNGAGYTFISGTAPTTCGGFNGLHNRYQFYSYTSDVDAGDATGCWYMQMVPNQAYGSASGYLDGYNGQNLDRAWQSMWLR